MITLALIARYPIVRYGLKIYIGASFINSNILVYDTISSMRIDYLHHTPEIIVFEIKTESTAGFLGIVKVIRILFPDAKIIFFNGGKDTEIIIKYLQAGVRGYISAENGFKELLACLATVQKGKYHISADVGLLEGYTGHFFS